MNIIEMILYSYILGTKVAYFDLIEEISLTSNEIWEVYEHPHIRLARLEFSNPPGTLLSGLKKLVTYYE